MLGRPERLKELTLPFAGAGSASTATNFGTLFNGIADDSKKKVIQFMEDGSSETYYLPAGLEKLTLSEGCEALSFGTFYNCNMLHELTLLPHFTWWERRFVRMCRTDRHLLQGSRPIVGLFQYLRGGAGQLMQASRAPWCRRDV